MLRLLFEMGKSVQSAAICVCDADVQELASASILSVALYVFLCVSFVVVNVVFLATLPVLFSLCAAAKISSEHSRLWAFAVPA